MKYNTMQLFITSICVCYLFPFVFANLDQELRKSIDLAMKCKFREPPKGPVIAVSPSRFAQVVLILHERFDTPFCFRPSKTPISVNDEKTWPFCIFGKCIQSRCLCAGNFVGPKCSTYSKKCWLMYCYLTSCHPVHQSLHCVCDPNLYGIKITTGIYWYDQGKSSKYVPPPSGWEDEPIGMIKLKSTSAIEMGRQDQSILSKDKGRLGENAGGRNKGYLDQSILSRDKGRLGQNAGGRNQGYLDQSIPSQGDNNRGLISGLRSQTEQKPVLSNKNIGNREPAFESEVQGSRQAGFKEKYIGNADEYREKAVAEKSDVEEALEELEASVAWKLNMSKINFLLLIAFSLEWALRIYVI